MKIIFLDIDGVLNSTNFNEPQSFMSRSHYINKENLDNLKTLVEQGNYKIVISSTWRKDNNFIEEAVSEEEIIKKFTVLFENYGWKNAPVIGITPNISGFRGQEVAFYLDSINIEKIEYLILDDDKDFILGSLLDISISKLDRLGIRSSEDAKQKSAYWSYQNLYLVTAQTGLSKEDVKNIIHFKENEVPQIISKKMK